MGGMRDFLERFADEVHHASGGDFACRAMMLQADWHGGNVEISADAYLEDARSGSRHLVKVEFAGPPAAWAVRAAKDAVARAAQMENGK